MNGIIRQLFEYQRKDLFFYLFSGIVLLAILMTVMWLSTFAADAVFHFSPTVRWILLIFNLTLSFYLFWHFFLKTAFAIIQLNPSSDFSEVAEKIGREHPNIADRLKNIYQLIQYEATGTSDQLKTEAIRKFSEENSEFRYKMSLRFKDYLPARNIMLMVFAGSVLLSFVLRNEIGLAAKRILNPTRTYESIPFFSFEVSPGKTNLLQGQNLQVRAKYDGPRADQVVLEYKGDNDPEFRNIAMNYAQGGFNAEIVNLRSSIEYRVKAVPDVPFSWRDNLISQTYAADVIIPPFVNELEVVVTPPVYTGLPVQYLEKNSGDIIAYKGSKAQLRARVNRPIQLAELVFSDGARQTAKVRDNTLNISFMVDEKTGYHVEVMGMDSIRNQQPIEYSITPLDDLIPAIDIIEPGQDIEISVDAGVALILEGNDDFGFTDLAINYQILEKMETMRDTTWQNISVEIPAGSGTFFQQTYLWNIPALSIGFGDEIRYYATLRDNDSVIGPKAGMSQIYVIRFPSLDQMFSEFNDQQDKSIDEIDELAAESEKLKNELEKITRELKREQQIDWQREREIRSTLEKQSDIQKKLEEMQKELDDAITRMERNNLLSPEILDKYQRLQELFQEIATPELIQAMQKLQQSLQQMKTNDAQAQLLQFKINQEKFNENLDRMFELFKKIQLEQQMDRLVKTAEKITAEQKEISRRLDENHIADRLEQQNELMNSLEQNLDMLIDEKSMQQYQEALINLSTSKEMIQQNAISSQIRQMQQQLKSTTESADLQNRSQKLENDFQDISEQLQQAQKNMRGQDHQKLMAAMEKSTDNLLRLSQNEESLMEQTQNVSPLSDEFRDLASRQQLVAENMRRVIQDLIEISRQTFFISPQINQSLGKANSGMRNSLNELENRNGSAAKKNQEQAMAGLNEAILNMQSSMEQMAQSGSALGFEQFMEQMQKMAGQQGQVNQESMNLMQGQGTQGGLSMEQQARYKRLAAEQRAIQQSLQNMHNEMGQRSDILGRMDQMAEEMEKIIDDLEKRQIDRKTIQRQQQILSRMLDAQKSVREKEYTRQRKAETGKYYARKSPPEDMETSDKRLRRLTIELLKALQEGYRPDYEKMIESYFQELNRQNLQDLQQRP